MSMAIESSYMAAPYLQSYASGAVSWDATCLSYEKECGAMFKKRMNLSSKIHPILFKKAGRMLLKFSAKTRTLPFEFLFHQLRTP